MSDISELAAWVDRLRNLSEQTARYRVDLELLESSNGEQYPHMFDSAKENVVNSEKQLSHAILKVKSIAAGLDEEAA